MSRTLKIHHRQRLSKNRRFHFGRDLAANPKELAKTINTPTPCSCWMCGNQRKHHGITLQEKKMLTRLAEIERYFQSVRGESFDFAQESLVEP